MGAERLKYIFVVIGTILALISVSEHGAMSWTITADFEKGKVGELAEGPSGFDGAGTHTFFSDEIAFTGTQSAKMEYKAGDPGFKRCRGTFRYPKPLSEGEEIWGRGYFYFRPPVDWWCKPRIKIFRIAAIKSDEGKWRGYISIFADQSGHIRLSNEVDDYEPSLGVYMDKGAWICLEIYVKLSTRDPIVRIWKNGNLIAEDGNHKTLLAETDRAVFSYIMSYWNGGPRKDQVVYVDDFVLTTEPPNKRDNKGNLMIGPISSSSSDSRPGPPKGLTIVRAER